MSGLDFGILDAEHAPFDRAGLDMMILGGLAAQFPLFVRICDHAPATILQSLDLGATGLVVPHVDTPEQALAIVRRARFRGGERGFSNSARFGRYGATMIEEAVEIGDRAEIICQIESSAAVENAHAIAAVPGVAGLLVGRADLALAMGLMSMEADSVLRGARHALGAARANGKLGAIVIGDTAEMAPWLSAGANFFVFGNEQGLLRIAAKTLAQRAADKIAQAAH